MASPSPILQQLLADMAAASGYIAGEVLASTGVTSVEVTDGGYGFTDTPDVSIDGGGGSGAEAQAVVADDGTVSDIIITSPGSNYTSPPDVSIDGGEGEDATATATISGPRRYMVPSNRNGWSGDLTDIQNMGKPFDRSALNVQASSLYSGDTIGHAMGTSIQVAYMGMLERAFRARHMSPVRAMIHAATRRQAHADSGGVLIAGVTNYVQQLLDGGDTE